MQVLVHDYETYYDSECSLSKLSTVEYVEHPDFEVIMDAVRLLEVEPDGSLSLLEKRVLIGEQQIGGFLAQLDWDDLTEVAHNLVFDGNITRRVFGFTPARYYCTMMAARPHLVPFSHSMSLAKLATYLKLDVKKGNFASASARGKHLADFTVRELEDYKKYAGDDAAICQQLYETTRATLDADEQLILHATLRKALQPTFVANRELLNNALSDEIIRKDRLFKNSGVEVDVIMSNPKFAKALESCGVSPPMKVSPRTGKHTFAFAKTDVEFQQLLKHKNEKVRTLVECRLNGKSTIAETRLRRFLGVSRQEGTIPFPLLYCGAHTGRMSGYDKLNMQNPTKGSPLRYAMCAPEDETLVVTDLNQIEARMVAWLSEVPSMMEAFQDPARDVYCEFGTSLGLWGTVTKETYAERFISKMGVLGLMYGLGPDRFAESVNASGQAEIGLGDAKKVVYGYRDQYPEIQILWNLLDTLLKRMINGQSTDYKGMRFVGREEGTMYGAPCILLPYGRILYYPELAIGGDGQVTYRGNKGQIKYLWGGSLLENCIAAGAEVLTDSGWKQIELVLDNDKVHDGVEFVTHNGLLPKNYQRCTIVDGVYMTPDHEVLTDDGWKAAETSPRPFRPNIRSVDCPPSWAHRWEETQVDSPMPVWHRSGARRHRSYESGQTGNDFELWLYVREKCYAWYERTSRLLGMAQYARPLQATVPSGMEKLWGAWDSSVRTVGEIILRLLAGYGGGICTGVISGPKKQRGQLHQTELPMGYSQRANAKQTRQQICGDPLGAYGNCRSLRAERDIPWHHNISLRPWVDGFRRSDSDPLPHKLVFDLLDCGPRSRFVVRGDDGPFVVHNCSQALAQIVIRNIELAMIRKMKYKPIGYAIGQVHDELIYSVPTKLSERFARVVTAQMSTEQECFEGLPLACETETGENYGNAK